MRTLKISLLVFILSITVSAQNLWEPSGNLSGTVIRKLIYNYSNELFAITGDYVIYFSTDNGNTWELFSNYFSESYIDEITFNRYNIPFILANDSTGYLKLYRTTDEGASWLPLSINISFGSAGGGLTTNLDYSMFAIGFDILKSTDDGETWVELNLPISNVCKITQDSTGNLYAQQFNNGYYSDFIYRSTDGGYSWLFVFDFNLRAFGCNKTGLTLVNGIGFSGTFFYDRMYKSSDFGNNWEQIGILPYHSIVVTSEGNIYGYGYQNSGFKLWCSIDQGETWIDYSAGLPDGDIRTLVIDTSGYLFAGTSDGVYRTVEQVTSVESNEIGHPTEYFLSQNYPNPFNPTTKIKYRIPEDSFVTLKLYGVLSNEIATLVNEEQPAGIHEVEFNAIKNSWFPASGVYIYQLRAGSFVETKKMILLK